VICGWRVAVAGWRVDLRLAGQGVSTAHAGRYGQRRSCCNSGRTPRTRCNVPCTPSYQISSFRKKSENHPRRPDNPDNPTPAPMPAPMPAPSPQGSFFQECVYSRKRDTTHTHGTPGKPLLLSLQSLPPTGHVSAGVSAGVTAGVTAGSHSLWPHVPHTKQKDPNHDPCLEAVPTAWAWGS
jgi:hypothetical protein